MYESIKNSLKYELYSNAAFLCERLLACQNSENAASHQSVSNDDVKLLLAESYLGEGKAYKAYEVLKDCKSDAARYKFALVCMKLNKFHEAERALLLNEPR